MDMVRESHMSSFDLASTLSERESTQPQAGPLDMAAAAQSHMSMTLLARVRDDPPVLGCLHDASFSPAFHSVQQDFQDHRCPLP